MITICRLWLGRLLFYFPLHIITPIGVKGNGILILFSCAKTPEVYLLTLIYLLDSSFVLATSNRLCCGRFWLRRCAPAPCPFGRSRFHFLKRGWGYLFPPSTLKRGVNETQRDRTAPGGTGRQTSPAGKYAAPRTCLTAGGRAYCIKH